MTKETLNQKAEACPERSRRVRRQKTEDREPTCDLREGPSLRSGRLCAHGCAGVLGGFTLIEVMLVMVILATMAAIVLPKFTGRSKQAKITAAKTQISQLEVALDAFEIDLSRYPTTAEGLRALVEKPTSDADAWQQPYLKHDVPKDPWGNDYVYRYPGQYNEDGYDLYSFGPDGKLGGEDDIANWSERRR